MNGKISNQEAKSLAEKYIEAREQAVYNVAAQAPEFAAAPTGWRSVPAFVRFAVWLWAIGTALLGTVGVGVAVALYIAYAISQVNQ